MRHPYENYHKAQLGSLLTAVFLAIVSLFQLNHQWIILLMFYVLAVSFLLESLIEFQRQQITHCVIQLLRALLIVIFTTIIYF